MFEVYLEALQQHMVIYLFLIAVFGLIFGSFFNVMIYRLPIMLFRDWREQCNELLDCNTSHNDGESEKFNLFYPRSHCTNCKKAISPWQNIPVFSYIFLAGKSACCKSKISIQYPLVEALTAIFAVIVAYHFGVSWIAIAAIALTWSLLILTFIDLKHCILPDNITLFMLWVGLLLNLYGFYANIYDAVIGAAAGYLSLWFVTWLFKLITGKIGMGNGDFKLLAMLGAWLGWQMLPFIILVSALIGTVIGVCIIVIKRQDKNVPIPFGPYLAIAGWVALLWGNEITTWYLHTLNVY